MAKPDRLTYVGELWGVTVEGPRGGSRFIEVSPAVLGVSRGLGMVTADSKADLARGIVHRDPGGSERPEVMTLVWYYRKRRSGAWWFHDTPRALARFDGLGPRGLPFVFIDSRGSVPCGSEDFICN